jgi:hypothetical protein
MSELLKVNVNDHTEKKNGLSYLSWAWAWAEVLKADPLAEWEPVEYPQPDGTSSPCIYVGGGTAMVKTRVTIKGKTRTCMLPVMDHRNKAIKDPDAFAINTAIMRCMTKAISMHGLGLYIYAGEDLPEGEEETQKKPAAVIPASFRSTATDGPVDVADDRQTMISLAASVAANKFKAGEKDAAFDVIAPYLLDNEEMLFLHHTLKPHSTFRAYIKFRQDQAAKRPALQEAESAF